VLVSIIAKWAPGFEIPFYILLLIGTIFHTFHDFYFPYTTTNLRRLKCISMEKPVIPNLYTIQMKKTCHISPIYILPFFLIVARLESEEFFNRITGSCHVITLGCIKDYVYCHCHNVTRSVNTFI